MTAALKARAAAINETVRRENRFPTALENLVRLAASGHFDPLICSSDARELLAMIEGSAKIIADALEELGPAVGDVEICSPIAKRVYRTFSILQGRTVPPRVPKAEVLT